MILPQHRAAIDALPRAIAAHLAATLTAAPLRRAPLSQQLDTAGRDQTHVIIALLTLGEVQLAEQVMGRHITKCPPCIAPCRLAAPVLTPPRTGDDRRVTWNRSAAYLKLMAQLASRGNVRAAALSRVGKRTLLTDSPFYDRWRGARKGLSLTQLFARGIRRRDVRKALRCGWLRIEGTARAGALHPHRVRSAAFRRIHAYLTRRYPVLK